MINDSLPPVHKKYEGIDKNKIDVDVDTDVDTDEDWVSGPTILIILIVAVSTVIYASLNPTQRKTSEVTSDYSVTEK